MIGERLGPFRIVELLGHGGLSEVYRAYHQETAQDVALKILKHAPDERTRTRFLREAEALQVLKHPNIITVLTVGEFERRPYYTMPFVRVLSLQEVMHQRFQVDRGRFSQDDVLRVVVDVARALRYAHGKGVLHRDVKPGNILMDPEFRPVLCDWGLARLAGTETVTRQGTMLGTPRYMAPEQLQGRRSDQRSDLYSLGMVAYEMATGSIPFDGGEPLAAAVRRLTETIPDLAALSPNLDPALVSLVMDMLARDPAARPEGAGDVVRVLQAMPGAPPPLDGSQDQDATEERQVASLEVVRRNPATFLVAGGLGVAALVALPLLLAGGPRGLELQATCRLVPFADHADVHVETDRRVLLGVRYGEQGQLAAFLQGPGEARREHRLELRELAPDSDYSFALVFEDELGTKHEEPPQRFRTAPAARTVERGRPR